MFVIRTAARRMPGLIWRVNVKGPLGPTLRRALAARYILLSNEVEGFAL
jgi:hypothetical protein